jgi:hypothetical protein
MRIPVELIHILYGWNVIGMCACLQHKGGFRHMRVQRTARGWNVPVGKDMHSFATLDEFLDSPLARKSGKSAFLPHTHTRPHTLHVAHSVCARTTHDTHTNTHTWHAQRVWG